MPRPPLMFAVLCALVLASSSRAQTPPPAKCPEAAAPMPSELAPWLKPAVLTAATNPEDAGKAELKVGVAATAALVHTPELKYAARPAKPGGSVAYGGLFHIAIPEAGTYRVAIGNASWIDVVRDGAKVESIHHGGGPACSGIRKMVDYPLQKGEYVVQLSAGGDAQTGVLVVKLP